jgi:hypothetical protein
VGAVRTGRASTDTELTGVFADDETVVGPSEVMVVIEDAREEEIQRQLRMAG